MSKRVIAALAEDLREHLTTAHAMDFMHRMVAALMKQPGSEEITDDRKVHEAYTAGDVRAVGAFWKVDWVLKDILAVYVSKRSGDIVGRGVMDYVDTPADLTMLISTAETVLQDTIPLLEEFCKTLPDLPVNDEAAAALEQKLVEHLNKRELEVMTKALKGIADLVAGIRNEDGDAVAMPSDAFVVTPPNNNVH